ncbi:MAG: thiamine pyrophosphate-binding protein [Gammaproteobacteria bacterium]|nr:thiamine pyrophosphate-binding protein [Gammaproteobacteria bacterium]
MTQTNEMTGGEALVCMLQAHGAGPMFGMGGFQLLPFYDAARRHGLDHNLINDERCAVFAADAYAKVSGRVGLVDATLGPGATNLVTGLVEALNAGSPIVAIVGDAQRDHAGKNMTQETDQVSILRPACKEVLRIEAIQRIPEIMRRAFAVATSGRPGPVVVDVPEDIAHGLWGFDEEDFKVDPAHEAAPALRCRPEQQALQKAAQLITQAERPILLCGGGIHISQAQQAVTRFAEDNGIPVAHTMSGKGSIACTSNLSAGIFGRYDRIANDLITESDCIIVAGCKLGEIATKRFTIPKTGQVVIHLDNVAEEMGRTYSPTLKLWCDVREGLNDLNTALSATAADQLGRRDSYLAEIPVKMKTWHDEVAAERLYSDETPINMARLITELNNHLPEDGHLVADGGFAAHWGGLLFNSRAARRTFVPDRGFASIGYGLPGAMGAQLAAPDAIVVGLTGDGGFNMVLGELETARRMKLGLTVIVVNNAASGYVKALQHLMYGDGNYQSSDLAETNYAKLAETMGCHGIRVEDPAALASALQSAFAEKNRPSVIDVLVTRDPAKMLPAVDNRTVQVKKGDRVA